MTDFGWLLGSLIVMISFGTLLSSFSFVEKTYGVSTNSQFAIYFMGLPIGMGIISFFTGSFSVIDSSEKLIVCVVLFILGFTVGAWTTSLFTQAVGEAARIEDVGAAVPMAIYGSSSVITVLLSYFGYVFFSNNFQALDLNPEKILAMFIIIFGVYKMGSDPNQKISFMSSIKYAFKGWNWFTKSLTYTFTMGLTVAVYSFIEKTYGIPSNTQFSVSLISIGIAIPLFSEKGTFTSIEKTKKNYLVCLILLIGAGAIFGSWANLTYADALGDGMSLKEVGAAIPIAIVGASSIVTALFSFWGYKLFPSNFNPTSLNKRNLFFMTLVIFGVYWLGIENSIINLIN